MWSCMNKLLPRSPDCRCWKETDHLPKINLLGIFFYQELLLWSGKQSLGWSPGSHSISPSTVAVKHVQQIAFGMGLASRKGIVFKGLTCAENSAKTQDLVSPEGRSQKWQETITLNTGCICTKDFIIFFPWAHCYFIILLIWNIISPHL